MPDQITMQPWTILRRQQVQAATGYSRSTLYARISRGLFPRPVNLGARARGWPTGEVATVTSACIAGMAEEQIKELVVQLLSARTAAGQALPNGA